jgi:enoyl-CoA hydratase
MRSVRNPRGGGYLKKAYVVVNGAVSDLVIDGPPLNLFDGQMIEDVETAVSEVGEQARNGQCRAMRFRAQGRVFSAGVDVHQFMNLSSSAGARFFGRFMTLVQTFEALPIPTVAVVHGLNLTIGFELSLACDMIWAAESASFGLVEATVGLTPGGGGTQRLAARAGVPRAAELVMTGDVYDAHTLREWGVVNQVVADIDLNSQTEAFAARLAAGPTVANGVAKKLLRTVRDHGVAAADAITASSAGPIFDTADLRAGLTTLLEKGPRQATFTGT